MLLNRQEDDCECCMSDVIFLEIRKTYRVEDRFWKKGQEDPCVSQLLDTQKIESFQIFCSVVL